MGHGPENWRAGNAPGRQGRSPNLVIRSFVAPASHRLLPNLQCPKTFRQDADATKTKFRSLLLFGLLGALRACLWLTPKHPAGKLCTMSRGGNLRSDGRAHD